MEDQKSACLEAFDLVNGERQVAYGDPVLCQRKIGRMWGAMLGTEDIEAEMVALMMVAVKLVRETNTHKRDNLIDIAGYAEIVDRARARR